MNEAPPNSHYTALSNATRLPSAVETLVEFFGSRDVEAYFVGGVVRDTLMGRKSEDIDIAVSVDAVTIGRQLAEALGTHCVSLHDEWQVARVVLNDAEWSSNVDIATIQGDIEWDLCRRDFTINAMALPMSEAYHDDVEERLLDPCGGLPDLHAGVVRMVSPDALDEDTVRLLRGVRLAAQLEFSLDSDTADSIRERAALVADAPQERVRDELMRLLRTHKAYAGVRLLDELGLLCSVMPELANAKDVTQPKEHYWDVFNHLIEAVGWVDAMFRGDCDDVFPLNFVPRFEGMAEYFDRDVSDGFDRLTFLKLTALLHDIAKPSTKTVEDSGRIRFLGHHSEGAETVRDILTRLRFGKRGVEHVAGMVQQHLRPTQMAQKGEMPTGRALYRYYRDAGDIALDTLYLNMADYLAARGPALERSDWVNHCSLMQYILEEGQSSENRKRKESVQSLPKLVDGYDIIDRFALASGPGIGKLLETVREAQASGEVSTKEQALELVRASLERGGDGA